MSYSLRYTQTAPTESDFYGATEEQTTANRNTWWAVMQKLSDAGSTSTPYTESETASVDSNGRAVNVRLVKGFTSAEDAEFVARQVSYALDSESALEKSTWGLAHDVRNKIEVINDADNSVTVLHDTIDTIPSRTRVLDSSAEDPFWTATC